MRIKKIKIEKQDRFSLNLSLVIKRKHRRVITVEEKEEEFPYVVSQSDGSRERGVGFRRRLCQLTTLGERFLFGNSQPTSDWPFFFFFSSFPSMSPARL